MNIGALEIQLTADMDQLKRDMADAKAAVGGAMSDVENYVGLAKTAFVGLLGVGSISAFAGMIKGSMDAAAGLHDLSIQTGASVAALGQFRSIGAYTETSADSIAGAMTKLAKNMSLTNEEGKGAALAIKALGIDFDTFRALSPDQQMLAAAQAMNKFEDGSDKSAAAMMLFGKEGAKLLPFLKDLGDGADGVRDKLTDQEVALRKTQAAMADAFGDNLTQIRKESDAWKKDIAGALTPALWELSQAFVDTSKGGNGLTAEISTLAKDGSITDWARTAITGVTYVMDVFSGLKATVKSVGDVIGAWAASLVSNFGGLFQGISQAISGDWSGAMQTMSNTITRQKTILSELGDSMDATWSEKTLGSKLRDRMDDLRNVGIASEDSKPKLNLVGVMEENERARKAEIEAQKEQTRLLKEQQAEAKKMQETVDKLSASIDEKTMAVQRTIESTRKQTEADKIEDKLYADLWNGTVLLTNAQLDAALAKIELLRQTEALAEGVKRERKEQEEATKAYADLIDRLQKGNDATQASIEKQRESNDTLLLSKEQLAQLAIQKDLDTAATWDQRAAWAEQSGLGADLVEQYKNQAQSLRDLASLKEQGIHVKAAKEAQDAWAKTTESIGKGLSSALTDAVMGGKDLWLAFRDYIVKTILDGAIKNAFAGVITNGLNSLVSSITGLNLGGSAGGAGGAVTSAAGSSLLDAAVNKLTGGTGGVSAAVSSVSGSISSALGLSGAGAGTAAASSVGAGSAAVGSAAATSSAVSSGGSIIAEALAPASEAASSAAAASSSSSILATAGPIAAAIATFAVMNSMNDKDGLGYWSNYDASGKRLGIDPMSNPDLYIAQRLKYRDNNPIMDALASNYVATAKSLGITPEAGTFGYDSAGDGTFNMGATFDGGHFRSGWMPDNAASLEAAKARAVFTALQASDKPASISSLFDGVDAGLMSLADIQTRLAQAAAAPKGSTVQAAPVAAPVAAAPATRSPSYSKYFDVPEFATGGLHAGGLRLVGEQGPELEATGPSRIYNATETASMLRSGGASNEELVTELRAMNRMLMSLYIEAKRTADATNGNGEAPMLTEVDA